MIARHVPPFLLTLCVVLGMSLAALSQGRITTPLEQLGNNLGDDYFLANYKQLTEYWRKLAQESDRMTVGSIGKTEEGRDMLMAIVTSPANHARLEHYRKIAGRLALAEGVSEEEAKALAKEGRAVVWIDGGLHASEVLVAQQLMETVYRMCALNDEETLRFLDDVIILFCNPNPDGQDLVADWYMRNKDPKKRSARSLPRLYQKYIGHDNNRDFYMVSQKETEAVCRVFYQQWFPQIVFNHHQTGPSGTVLFAPPFRDPFNHNYDPLVPIGINLVGAAIHQRFLVENKPGATMRSGASYSTWWNGGLRTNVYFHNMIGLLTETIGSPTPMSIPLRLQRQLAHGDLPAPISPQKWHFRQSLEYSVTSNRAVFDVASRHREQFLFNAWRMGKNSIERGSRDHWTIRPRRIIAAQAKLDEASGQDREGNRQPRPDVFKEVLHHPDHRDPRGYIIPSDQADFPNATHFVNTLMKNGIAVHRATAEFTVADKTYPGGSYVVQCAQAYRPQVIDMFEPQDHPDDIPYPGGPPKAPYDSAGWTLAYQMGVTFDRVLEGFEGPFEKLEGLTAAPRGRVRNRDRARGFWLSCDTNASFIAVNRLLRGKVRVQRILEAVESRGITWPAGSYFITARPGLQSQLQKLTSLGIDFRGSPQKLTAAAMELKPARIGLWDRYGGSMPSGWLRWILEKFEFDFELVFPKRLDAGDLAADFDVLLFVPGGIPQARGGSSPRRGNRPRRRSQGASTNIPKKYQDWQGSVTADKTIPQLKKFMEEGGTVVTIGSSTALAQHLGLPLTDALTEKTDDGSTQPLPREKFFVPGSVLRTRVDTTHPVAWGAREHVDVMFRRSPAFRLRPGATTQGIRTVAWFDSEKPLRSGWAWGQHHLLDSIAMIEAPVGKGTLYLFGPDVTYRAQPYGTFRFVFNAVHCGPGLNAQRAAAGGRSEDDDD